MKKKSKVTNNTNNINNINNTNNSNNINNTNNSFSITCNVMVEVTDFGTNPGNLKMWAFVPSSLSENASLVVALHGNGQKASDYVNAGFASICSTKEITEFWGLASK